VTDDDFARRVALDAVRDPNYAPPPMFDPKDGPLVTPDGSLNHRVGMNRFGKLVRNPWYTPTPPPPSPQEVRAAQLAAEQARSEAFKRNTEVFGLDLPGIGETPWKRPGAAAAAAPAQPNVTDQLNDLFKHFGIE
jgi:hypothetical protein